MCSSLQEQKKSLFETLCGCLKYNTYRKDLKKGMYSLMNCCREYSVQLSPSSKNRILLIPGAPQWPFPITAPSFLPQR